MEATCRLEALLRELKVLAIVRVTRLDRANPLVVEILALLATTLVVLRLDLADQARSDA